MSQEIGNDGTKQRPYTLFENKASKIQISLSSLVSEGGVKSAIPTAKSSFGEQTQRKLITLSINSLTGTIGIIVLSQSAELPFNIVLRLSFRSFKGTWSY